MSTKNCDQIFVFLLSIIVIYSAKINAFSLIAQQNNKLICGYYCNQVKINEITKIPKFVNKFPELCTKWKDCDEYFLEFVETTPSIEVTTSKSLQNNEEMIVNQTKISEDDNDMTTFINLNIVNQQGEEAEIRDNDLSEFDAVFSGSGMNEIDLDNPFLGQILEDDVDREQVIKNKNYKNSANSIRFTITSFIIILSLIILYL